MKIPVNISRFLIIPIFLIKTKQEIFTKIDEEPNGFFVNFGDYIYFRVAFLSITTFSMRLFVNISPDS